jgi:alpha-L-glutamate ligase-like protein
MRWSFASPGELDALGVLGINERNNGYTLRWNERRFYPRVDDKLETKRLCAAAGIPTARVLGVANVQGEVDGLVEALDSLETFALKPGHGAMGNGILVVRGRDHGAFLAAGGRRLDRAALHHHASSIVSGLFSLTGRPDAAFAEELLEVHPDLARISSGGVPALRIIVFRGIPVMAMTRLPTVRSRGRANLHQGAVGAGVSLSTGRTTRAVIGTHVVEIHPDTGERVMGTAIPDFDRALAIAVAATDETLLGYVGADVVIDARYGPLVLELNARPGLAIQVANGCGLLPRLEAADRHWRPGLSLDRRIELGREIECS